MSIRTLLVTVSLLAVCNAVGAYDATSSKQADLSGHWKLNAALSDDAEAKLQLRLEEERKQYERWLRKARNADPLGLPPLGADVAPSESETGPGRSRPRRERRDDELRRLLGMSATLDIVQQGTRLQIDRDGESRRFEAGSRSQVSMPEGQLADSQVGWDGEWFVIDRKVRRGPRVVERYRLLKKTGQLESTLAWSGDHVLAGIKLRRIYDRGVKNTQPPDPAGGPSK